MDTVWKIAIVFNVFRCFEFGRGCIGMVLRCLKPSIAWKWPHLRDLLALFRYSCWMTLFSKLGDSTTFYSCEGVTSWNMFAGCIGFRECLLLQYQLQFHDSDLGMLSGFTICKPSVWRCLKFMKYMHPTAREPHHGHSRIFSGNCTSSRRSPRPAAASLSAEFLPRSSASSGAWLGQGHSLVGSCPGEPKIVRTSATQSNRSGQGLGFIMFVSWSCDIVWISKNRNPEIFVLCSIFVVFPMDVLKCNDWLAMAIVSPIGRFGCRSLGLDLIMAPPNCNLCPLFFCRRWFWVTKTSFSNLAFSSISPWNRPESSTFCGARPHRRLPRTDNATCGCRATRRCCSRAPQQSLELRCRTGGRSGKPRRWKRWRPWGKLGETSFLNDWNGRFFFLMFLIVMFGYNRI